MKNVITYGTFDLFHYGHFYMLERAKAHGDFLIVAVSTDEFNLLKGKNAHFSFSERKRLLENLKIVDMVIAESSWEQKIKDVKKYNIDTFVIGNDWLGEFDFLKDYCKVKYLERTPGVSSTQLRSLRVDHV